MAANPPSNTVREMWWGKSCGQSQSMTSAEFHFFVCLYRFSSPFPDILAATPSGGHSSLGWWWGLGREWWQILTAPDTDPHALFCFSAQDRDASVIFAWFSVQTERWKGKVSLFSPHKMGQDFPLPCSPWKTCRNVPQEGHWTGFSLNAPGFLCAAQLWEHAFLLMLKNSEKPPKAHSWVLSGNPGVKKQGKVGSPDLFEFL